MRKKLSSPLLVKKLDKKLDKLMGDLRLPTIGSIYISNVLHLDACSDFESASIKASVTTKFRVRCLLGASL